MGEESRSSRQFDDLTSYRNLHRAARRAARGKRGSREVAQFLFDLENNVVELQEQLRSGRWQPHGYRTFEIVEPKRRLICAAPFRDRVVHQALVQAVEPLFEPGFVFDSYSSRRGKGTHRALRRVFGWAHEYPWVLKLDIRKYFPSIDHAICLERLARRVHCPRTIEHFRRVLESWESREAPIEWFPNDSLLSPSERRRGLPIGNLTSQFLANVYLDSLDHLVKDRLRVRPYARYCDDLVVFGRSVEDLRRIRDTIVSHLAEFRLRPHPGKTHIHPTRQGVPWLGFRVEPNRIRLNESMLGRARRYLRKLGHQRRSRWLDNDSLVAIVRSWRAHAAHAQPDRIGAAMVVAQLNYRARRGLGRRARESAFDSE